MIINFKMYME